MEAHWSNHECGIPKEAVKYFVTEISYFFLNTKKDVDYLKKFATFWYVTVDVSETYVEHLILQLTLLYMTSDSENKINDFAKNVHEFYSQNVQKFSHLIIDIFSKTLKDLMSDFFPTDNDVNDVEEYDLFTFYTALMDINKSPENFAMILPNEYSLTPYIATQHKLLLAEIRQCHEPCIKILYNHYMTKFE